MPEQLPQNIDEVLTVLEEIIESTTADNNFLGIFAFVYHRVTAAIKAATEAGEFEDNERMQDFDVTFANLYIDAFRKYKTGEPIHQSWKISFDAANENLTILQHLLLGMNAHINLDLGVAAAKIMEGKDINALEKDFMKVNDVLFGLTNEMQQRMGKVSGMMFLLDWIGARTDEKIIDFGMQESRELAWKNAVRIHGKTEAERLVQIGLIDEIVMQLGSIVRAPKTRLLRFVFKVIKFMEVKNVKEIIAGLEADVPKIA